MLSTVEGMYEDGRIVLTERPPGVSRCRVLVTFVAPAPDQQGSAGDRRGKLLASLARGLDLGGPPYPSREELYLDARRSGRV